MKEVKALSSESVGTAMGLSNRCSFDVSVSIRYCIKN